VFICSQSGIVVIEINKFYRPSYGFHQIFVTRLTTLNVLHNEIRVKNSSLEVKVALKVKYKENYYKKCTLNRTFFSTLFS